MQRSTSSALMPQQALPPTTDELVADTQPAGAGFGPWGHDLHWHPYGQFIYATAGSCRIEIGDATYPVDVLRGVWIPPMLAHSARFSPGFGGLLIETGPIREAQSAVAMVVPEDLRNQLLAAAWSGGCTSDLIMAAVKRLLTSDARRNLTTPMPRGPLAGSIAAALVTDPGDPRTLAEWAYELHVAVVTIRRAFKAETGLSFTEWRSRLRVNEAIARLQQDEPVSVVAQAVGLTHNGLIAAFQRHLGCSPSALLPATGGLAGNA